MPRATMLLLHVEMPRPTSWNASRDMLKCLVRHSKIFLEMPRATFGKMRTGSFNEQEIVPYDICFILDLIYMNLLNIIYYLLDVFFNS